MELLSRLIVIGAVLAAAIWGSQQVLARLRAEEVSAPRPEAPPIPVDTLVLQPTAARWTVPPVGSILPYEQVEVTSEDARRIVAIHFEEGDEVKAGDLLFELDRSDLEAEVRELEAIRNRIQLRETRLGTLRAAEAASASEYDEARLEGKATEARIERIKVDITRSRIVAPFAGRVGFRRVSIGAFIQDGDTLTTLTDDSRVRIDFRLPERYAAAARVGGSFLFRSSGASDAAWQSVAIAAVESVIETDTRSLVVRGEIDNPKREFIPGAFVEIEVVERESDNALMIPTRAVVPGARGPSLYVLVEGRAFLKDVMLGERTAELVEVLGGVSAGETLITSNIMRLRPNVRVAPVVAAP
jgi:membrane fusion protein (multidrug efflux system)